MSGLLSPRSGPSDSIHASAIGIRTSGGTYLNVEKFNFQLTCDAKAMKGKQTFELETDGKAFYVKCHMNTYLTADRLGVVTCGAQSQGPTEAWMVDFEPTGMVTFKNAANGMYLKMDGSAITCKEKAMSEQCRFELVLGIHPQICIRTQQKRFFRVKGEAVVCPEPSQFGIDTMLTLEYQQKGKWALKGCTGKYFSVGGDGTITASKDIVGASELFTLVFYTDNTVAIRSCSANKFLSAQGAQGSLKAAKAAAGKQEKLIIRDSDAQVTVQCASGAYISHQENTVIQKKGTPSDREIYLLETAGHEGFVAFKNVRNHYWTVNGTDAFDASAQEQGKQELFTLEYKNGKVAIKTANGKYLSAKGLGGVAANKKDAGDDELFTLHFLNRPQIALKTFQRTFVGVKGQNVVANKTIAETFGLEYKDGKYAIKAATGNYLGVIGEKVVPTGSAEQFELEFHQGKVAIKAKNGKYLTAENHGGFVAKASAPGKTELFEY